MMNTLVILNSDKGLKIHPSCMIKEVIYFLNLKEKNIVIDATFGTGGHSFEILNKIPHGILIAFEKDPYLFKRGKEFENIYKNFKIFNKSFTDIPEVLQKENIKKIDGILFDFGVSFFHISSSKRGFTYKRNEILDMRYNPEEGKPLYYHLKKLREKEIGEILKEYGELKNWKKIAQNIIKERKSTDIKTTFEFNEIILKGLRGNKDKILQKTYQAFRIWVNNEIQNIQKVLSLLPSILRKGARVVFLTYHSIEDRIIKNFLKNKEFKILTKKPLSPSAREIKEKPNCRSCKLRAGEKI